MRYYFVETEQHLNSVITTYDHNRKRGYLNAWGNSLPAEELPFGAILTVDSVPFRLPPKLADEPDNLEPLGHSIVVRDAGPSLGIAFLGCGEMGDQHLTGRIASSTTTLDFTVMAKGSMVPPNAPLGPDGFRVSHLHYPGDYELDLMTAAVWCFRCAWGVAIDVQRIKLEPNPLVHVLAITLFGE